MTSRSRRQSLASARAVAIAVILVGAVGTGVWAVSAGPASVLAGPGASSAAPSRGRAQASPAPAVTSAAPQSAAATPATPAAIPAVPTAALPACTMGNVQTPLASAADWASVILDTRLRLPATYVPPDLVSTGLAGLNADQQLRSIVIGDLHAMAVAARASGVQLRVLSGYRSYSYQLALYRTDVARLGLARARLIAALPGHSEHQLGTAFDVAATPGAYAWVDANAWRFGWVQSFPPKGTPTTCMTTEPWHLRYVGRAEAAAIHGSRLTERAWLWENVPAARG